MKRFVQFLRSHALFFGYAAIVIWITSAMARVPPSAGGGGFGAGASSMRGGRSSGSGWSGGK